MNWRHPFIFKAIGFPLEFRELIFTLMKVTKMSDTSSLTRRASARRPLPEGEAAEAIPLAEGRRQEGTPLPVGEGQG